MSDALARLISSLANRYAIENELGAGGMATVRAGSDHTYQSLIITLAHLRPASGSPDRP